MMGGANVGAPLAVRRNRPVRSITQSPLSSTSRADYHAALIAGVGGDQRREG